MTSPVAELLRAPITFEGADVTTADPGGVVTWEHGGRA
jgi:hypothetical protein